MITYCTGSASAKRKMFRSSGGADSAVCLDNDEVLAAFTLYGKQYFVIGDIPFSNMTIGQYVAFSKSLTTSLPMNKEEIKRLIKKTGLKCRLSKKMSSLSRTEYRAAALAAKADEFTQTVYVNFDGLMYTRRNFRRVAKILFAWQKQYEVYAAVSDTRFIPENADVLSYNRDSVSPGLTAMRNRPIRKRLLKKRLYKAGMNINLPLTKSVIESF